MPDNFIIGGRAFQVEFLDLISDSPDIASRLDCETDTIQIKNGLNLGLMRRHLIIRLVCAINRNLSPDAGLTKHENAFGHALFNLLAMNKDLLFERVNEVYVPGHVVKIVEGTTDPENEGEIDMSCMELRVKDGLEGYARQEVIWHELVHMLGWLIDVEYKEWQVCFLAFCLAMLFTQNDFRWLYEDTDR